MAFTRTTTINAAPGGDSVKQAVLDLDTDLTGAFANANTTQNALDVHKGLTTNPHSVTYAQVGAAALAGSSTQDFAAKNLTTSDNTTLGDATTDTLTVGVNGIVKTATGNVLIGTTTDDGVNKLQVNGDIKQYSTYPSLFQKPSAWSSPGYIQMGVNSTGSTGGDYWLHNVPSGKSFSWAFGNVTVMALSSTGNLLVGTTTDDGVNKLQVNGGIYVSGSADFKDGIKFNGSTGAIPLTAQYDIRLSAVSNTALQVQMRGTDGVIRTTTLTLA